MNEGARVRKTAVAALIILSLTIAIWGATPGKAHSADNGWKFELAPYLWMANISGDVTIRGFQASTDVSFSDIWDNLDFATELHFEAWKGPWAFFLDPTYLKMSSDAKVGATNVSVKSEMALVEFGGIYRLIEEPLGEKQKRFVALDLLLGGRYNSLKGTLEFPGGLQPNGEQDWLDPFLGARLRWEFFPKLELILRSDLGGFGIGSKIAWNNSLLLQYKPKDWLGLVVGYRNLYMDYESGSGSNLFKYDVTMQGPIIALHFSF